MGMGRNVFVATSLVDLYAKCGSMGKAGGVFDGMVEKDVVSWSAMIGGYASNGLPKEALELFFRMQRENVKPDCFTVVGVLSACASLGALELGDQLADKNHDVQLANFVESEFLGEQVVESIKKISEYLAQLRRIGQGHRFH